MNKFVEYDIHNGITLLKCAIMNILNALDSMEIDSYEFGEYISMNLIMNCMLDSGWEIADGICYSPTRRDFVFVDNLKLELYNGQYSNFNAI